MGKKLLSWADFLQKWTVRRQRNCWTHSYSFSY